MTRNAEVPKTKTNRLQRRTGQILTRLQKEIYQKQMILYSGKKLTAERRKEKRGLPMRIRKIPATENENFSRWTVAMEAGMQFYSIIRT